MMGTTIVIFGASGDLTARKLLPALYSNFRKGRLPANTRIVGFSRTPFTDDAFRDKMHESITAFSSQSPDAQSWSEFAQNVHYQPGNLDKKEDYAQLFGQIGTTGSGGDNLLFYLATAPELYPVAIGNLGATGIVNETDQSGFRRIIIEKPFGHDLDSALLLNRQVHDVFREKQVYRIDHYLGKETVQNLLVFRFGNSIFEPIWNRNYIDHVQITVAETVGVGRRADYYEKAGVLRDMFQNHLLQLLTFVAMEPPAVYEADALRNEKVKVFMAFREISPKANSRQSVRAQYEGYTFEPGVDARSTTATYAALQLFIDNWRWQGVPFYLRSGKMMNDKRSEITIQFRQPPHQIFNDSTEDANVVSNRLSIRIQPDEGLHLRFITKVPDQGMKTRPVDMEFHYRDSFGAEAIPEAYERLLMDAISGDASLFARSDEIELAWKLIDSIEAGWISEFAPPVVLYKRNSWGPDAANELLSRDGRSWVQDPYERVDARISP